MGKTQTVKAVELVQDTTLYPRTDIDRQAVGHLVEALASGVTLPPVVVCRETNKIIDGFHRTNAHLRFYGIDADIEVIYEAYTSDKERFLDAIKYNACHGVKLDKYDRAHCAIIGKSLRISQADLSTALNMQLKRIRELLQGRTAVTGKAKEVVPIKRTIEHMAGQKLTDGQQKANKRLSGMRQSFYVNQVLLLIENGLIDLGDEELLERMQCLLDALQKFLPGVEAA